MDVSLLTPCEIAPLIRVHFLGFLRRVGMQFYGPRWPDGKDLLNQLEDQLDWAIEKKQALLISLYFWWIYASVHEITRAVDEVERRARPWISDATLTRVREFARRCIWEMRWCAFLPENTNYVLRKLRDTLIVGVVLLDDHSLNIREPEARAVIKDKDVMPTLFPSEQVLREVRTRERRITRMALVTEAVHQHVPVGWKPPSPKEQPEQPQPKRVRFNVEEGPVTTTTLTPIPDDPTSTRAAVQMARALERQEETWLGYIGVKRL
jgi:hypothetical protein